MILTEQFIHSQLNVKLPIPGHDFTGQTIIVTGSNCGLGFEAARYFVHLNAAKVIMAVRSTAKGEDAKADIESSTGKTNVIDVRELDLASYASVKKFAESMNELPRIDAVVQNAGMVPPEYQLVEENESSLTVNVVSTILLTILLLPTLRHSADRYGTLPKIAVVSSGSHVFIQFPEWNAERIFDTLNDKETANMRDRYSVSKLVLLLATRELAQKLRPEPKVVVTSVAPGLCHSNLARNIKGDEGKAIEERKAQYARTAEEGSRTLVHAVTVGFEANGRYLSDCEVREDTLSEFVRSENGQTAQKKIWKELEEKLEAIEPGIMGQV